MIFDLKQFLDIVVSMIVRRVSYFTFIVAITTLASVSACHTAMAEAVLADAEANMVSFSFDLNSNATSITCYQDGIKRALLEQGIKSDAFKIIREGCNDDNTIRICLVFDKDYKGQVSSKIFTVHALPAQKPVVAAYTGSGSPAVPQYFMLADQRREIARRNLILLE